MTQGVGVVSRDVGPEWWERWAPAVRSWWASDLGRWTRRTVVLVSWCALAYLTVVLLVWPTARSAAIAWVGSVWAVLATVLLARTRTVRIGTALRFFSVCLFWSLVVGAMSWVVAVPLAGARSVDQIGPTVVVASVVEEVLKLTPLALVALLAPGRLRRCSVVDWGVLGVASGAAFQAVEEMGRRVVLLEGGGGLLDFCRWVDQSERLGCYGVVTFGLWPYPVGFAGPATYASHPVVTGCCALAIGIGIASWRRGGVVNRGVAVVLPLATISVAVLDHMARNASQSARWDRILPPASIPQAFELIHLLLGAGRGRVWLLLLLLVGAICLDARVLRETDPFPGRPSTGAPAKLQAYASMAQRWPRRFRSPVTALLEAAALASRDLRDWWCVALGPTRGETRREHVSALLAVGEVQRRAREDALGAAHDGAGGRRLARWLAVLAIATSIFVVLVLAPLWTQAVSGLPAGAWLAGMLELLGEWWSDLPLLGKIGVGMGIGAAVALTGGSLALAFGAAGAATSLAGNAPWLADLVRDPRTTVRTYALTHTPAEVATDSALLLISFSGYGLAGSAVGRGARAGRSALADPALRRSLRDHRGELLDLGVFARANSGVPIPVRVRELPSWLRRVRAGRAWHREQQAVLDLEGGQSELAVVRHQDLASGAASRYYHWVDHYAHQLEDPEILSMKHTQLADISPDAAYAYLREAATKYRPGIPIAQTASTPPWLVGKVLEGRLILLVPEQRAPIPRAILDRAADLDIAVRQIT